MNRSPRIEYRPIDEKAAKALNARPKVQEREKTEEFLIQTALYNASSLMCDAVNQLEHNGKTGMEHYKLKHELTLFEDMYKEAYETNNLEMKKLAIEIAHSALEKAILAIKENQVNKASKIGVDKEYITDFERRVERDFKKICEIIKKNKNQD